MSSAFATVPVSGVQEIKFRTIVSGIADLFLGGHYASYQTGAYLGELVSQKFEKCYKNINYASYSLSLRLTFKRFDGSTYEISHTNGWDYNRVELL